MSDRAPRPADLPPPRDADGLSQGAMRVVFTGTYRWLLATALRLRLTPFQLTMASLATNVLVGWLLLDGGRVVPGLLLVPAGVFDVLDGAVARQLGRASRGGAFLDSFLDRVSDLLVLGCLALSLGSTGEGTEAALALVALVVSLGVSHVRAEGEAVGLTMTGGLMQRMERAIAMVIGLVVPGALLPALAILAALGAATLLQRSWMALAGAGKETARG
ncbi:MAG: CDP-alcohol phosphatidyltransferase family protein [Actinomycetota bacterium]